MSMVQRGLPGMGADRISVQRPPRRRRSYARVWSDPAVLEAEGRAQHRFDEWRSAFAQFLAHLPARRREELRRRLAGRRQGPPGRLTRAA